MSTTSSNRNETNSSAITTAMNSQAPDIVSTIEDIFRKSHDKELLSNIKRITALEKILHCHPSSIAIRNEENNNLPLHDLFDKCFNVTIITNNINNNNDSNNGNKLALLVKNVKHVMQILVNHGVKNNIGGVHGVGGLFELNKKKIDFVTYKSCTPFDMLLNRFQFLLEHLQTSNNNEATSSSLPSPSSAADNIDNRSHNNRDTEARIKIESETDGLPSTSSLFEENKTILQNISECIQDCIEVTNRAWIAKGCKDSFTIIYAAVQVFPLLKIETMQYLIDNFDNHTTIATTTSIDQTTDDQQSNSQQEDHHRHPLEFRDIDGRTVLMKAIHEATSRTQRWCDWKARMQMFLKEKHNGLKQCWIRDDDGRLPIHIAVEKGLEWNNGMQELVEIDSSTLLEKDPLTGLYPFMSIASGESADLNLVTHLLLENPAAIDESVHHLR